jgi:hypothetical protein
MIEGIKVLFTKKGIGAKGGTVLGRRGVFFFPNSAVYPKLS